MTKSQKKALRFAYDLLRGEFNHLRLPYVYAPLYRHQFNHQGDWIEPDQDPTRPFLNEATFSALMLKGYFECDVFPANDHADGRWLYRLTKRGCEAMGWDWPLTPPYTVIINRKPNRHMTRNLRPFSGRHRKRARRGASPPFYDDPYLRPPRNHNLHTNR
ncbi:MAG: hypothetical protein OHK0046_24710 [Anaerolineae bacterium]